jgi:hypothetical protein
MTSIDKRSNRRGLAAVAVAASICAATLGSSTTSAARGDAASGCRPAGSTTLAADGRARVYSVPLPRAGFVEAVRIFGCTFASGRPLPLGSAGLGVAKRSLDPKGIALHAPWVAYSATEHGVDTNQVWVVVRNLRNGRVKLTHDAAPELDAVEKISAVTDIAVSGSGGVAWISSAGSLGSHASGREVAAVDSNGTYTVLDNAAGIDPHSLALSGQQLTWTDAGARHSATLR